MKIIQKCISMEVGHGSVLLKTDGFPIKILFLTDDIIRIRASINADFEEESYCLMMTAWEDRMDQYFKDKRKRLAPLTPQISENDEVITIKGRKMNVIVHKNPFQISVYDDDNTCIYNDVSGIAYMEDGNHRRLHYSEIEPDDCFYGFGEKGGAINKAKSAMRMSGKDALGYDPYHTDGLYKHIPFYIKLSRQTQKAVGFFYHNTHECEFNMGKEKSNYWHYYSKYSTDGGDIDLFLIQGPKISDIVKRYTDLTGKSVLLPRYALGYLGSSMYYSELEADCDDEILNFIDTNHREGIPIDGFQLSSGYTVQENNKRCTFTWNHKRFKAPKNFFQKMEEKGVTVSPNVKPGILLVHPKFEEMKRKGMFVKNSSGDDIGTGSWWGGEGAFIDFTDPRVRELWKQYLTEQVIKMGTTSIWNDNCEYDSLVDKDCICSFEGKGGTIGQLKSVMANLMCHSAFDAVEKAYEQRRPFIVCRAGYSGIQQYAQTWSGDNKTCYESLKYNIATILGMGLSGVANQGSDIGGFYGPAPDSELFVRWVQNGVFQPRFSIHSVNIDNTVTEPWMYEEVTKLIREAIKMRYRFVPYLYSLMAESSVLGVPIMRPMFYEFQDDTCCYEEGIDFMLGESLLVANVVEKGAKKRMVYFPKGSVFYDYYTREIYYGGQGAEIEVSLKSIPLFVRDGGIIPYSRDEINNLHSGRTENLGILMEGSRANTFTYYEDDGFTNLYKKGEYKKTIISITPGEKIIILLKSEGRYESNVKTLFFDLISREKSPHYIQINDKVIKHYLYNPDFDITTEGWYYNHSLKSVEVKCDYKDEDIKIIVSMEEFDMIGM